MDAQGVIESYVNDVARRLPRAKRNDVAFELRALLTDELRARAESEGRDPDLELAMDMVRAFGRPNRTAARYHEPFAIIEPSDTWSFLVAALAGGTLISLLAAVIDPQTRYEQPQPVNAGFLGWLGLLVVGFGVKNLVLRYRPEAFGWKPRPVKDSDVASRAADAGVALLWLALAVLYIWPGWVVNTLTGGRVEAKTLAYSENFMSPLRMPWLVGLVVAVIGLQLLVAAQRRWGPGTRWARIALHASVAVQLGWHASYGNIFQDPQTDVHLTRVFATVSALIWTMAAIELYREYIRVRPAPGPRPTPEEGLAI